MKKKVLFAALSALALTACVDDETIEMNPGNALVFRASTENSTRSTIATSNSLNGFNVWAYHQNGADPNVTTEYMVEQEVTKNDNGQWTYNPTRFWPESGTIDFYSVSPTDVTTSITEDAQKIEDYTVNADISQQADLLYAVNKGCSKETNGETGVQLNFRHALSQIVFKAKNTNTALEVDIQSVKVTNVISKGTFTYPTLTTTPQLTGTDNDTETDGTWGKWTLGSDLTTYTAGVTEKTSITSTAVDLTTAGSGELLLLPQTLTAWNPSKGAAGSGSRFLISCKVWNVSGDDKILLWPNTDTYSEVAVPISATWKQGKKYTYTFVFGDGIGYTPEGEVISIPINFDVTVDNFQEGSNTDMDMEVEEVFDGINMDKAPEIYGGGNCFVVPQATTDEGTTYYFDATTEGRSDDPVGTIVHGKGTDIQSVEILDGDDIITNIEYKKGKLFFKTVKDKSGNAMVAVKDKDGVILWSWHIWVVTNNSFMTNQTSGTFMDRDLGASSAGGNGPYYQWGNKNYNFRNKKIAKATLSEAIKNPGFISSGDQTSREWFKADENTTFSDLWGDDKLFAKLNPAPKGWTIPDNTVFQTIKNEESYIYNDSKKSMTYNGKTVTIGKGDFVYTDGKVANSGIFTQKYYYLKDTNESGYARYARFSYSYNTQSLSVAAASQSLGMYIRPIKE